MGGLLKHAAATERSWARTIRGKAAEQDESGYLDTFTMSAGDTGASLVAGLDRAGTETEVALRAVDDLGSKVQLPEAPWMPRDPDGFSIRWIALHLLEELARHA